MSHPCVKITHQVVSIAEEDIGVDPSLADTAFASLGESC